MLENEPRFPLMAAGEFPLGSVEDILTVEQIPVSGAKRIPVIQLDIPNLRVFDQNVPLKLIPVSDRLTGSGIGWSFQEACKGNGRCIGIGHQRGVD